MISRRIFAGCGLCAAIGLVATEVAAQPGAASGVTRTELARSAVPGTKFDTIQVSAVIAAGATVPRHTHPGIESATVMEGEGVLSVQGMPDRPVKAGDSFLVPPETPHGLKNSATPMRIAGTYVVDRDKPLASPA